MPKMEYDKILSCLDNLHPLAQLSSVGYAELSGLILLKKKESNVSLMSFPRFFSEIRNSNKKMRCILMSETEIYVICRLRVGSYGEKL